MTVDMTLIKDLRERTGISISACKKALEEAGGDIDKAIDVLRKTGEAKADAKASRTTDCTYVVIKTVDDTSAMVELNCETDFVARDESFQNLANELADKLLNGEIEENDQDLPEVKAAIMKLGENIKIKRMKLLKGDNVGSYLHNNQIGVLVSFIGGNTELGRDIAMHIAATNPKVISPEEISDELVNDEKEIWREQLANEGKPAEILEKIMMGKESKFRNEHALIKQQFVKNPEITIEQLLKEAEATIKEFVRFGV